MGQDKVTFTQINARALVDALDPSRNDRKVIYRFSNGREFKGRYTDWGISTTWDDSRVWSDRDGWTE